MFCIGISCGNKPHPPQAVPLPLKKGNACGLFGGTFYPEECLFAEFVKINIFLWWNMKKVWLLLLICILIFSGCTEEPAEMEETVVEMSSEPISLSPLPAEELGAAAYLVADDFALTEANLISSLTDFFAAPCALDFYLEDADGAVYRCDDPMLNRKFGEVLSGAGYKVISMRKYDAVVAHGSVEDPYLEASYLRAYFANDLGQVSVIIGKDGTYLDFYRDVEKEREMNESGRTFYTSVDLFEELEAVKTEILESCEIVK